LSGLGRAKSFDKLTDSEQKRINSYGFFAEIFQGFLNLEVLQVFAPASTRISVPVKLAGLRNGRFFGLFKQSVYKLGARASRNFGGGMAFSASETLLGCSK